MANNTNDTIKVSLYNGDSWNDVILRKPENETNVTVQTLLNSDTLNIPIGSQIMVRTGSNTSIVDNAHVLSDGDSVAYKSPDKKGGC